MCLVREVEGISLEIIMGDIISQDNMDGIVDGANAQLKRGEVLPGLFIKLLD